ncbi:MAG: hypothetical protein L6R38_008845 [Xanthoria sp. 2 TBL-2021]|nr:MAG: hypothetical protein L6R38_008845 [Xanthoria sp. 2 TBL-2021]
MATQRALIASSRCRNCRSGLADVSNALISSPLRSAIGISRVPCKTSNHKRRFSRLLQPRSELVSWKASTGLERVGKDSENEPEQGKCTESQALPWYLQVQTPRQEPKSISERQRLPDLPPDPPPLLQPMLQHISGDLGLDDLSLLDLRDIDPPPALGANLLMVIGTARSEKHLHVSADRFCRWLRTTHRLTPYADGLLGRGELRLKLKRKNRRTRMLNSVGASDSSNTDDGIRTGWVCVNIGMVEDGRAMPHQTADLKDDNYVGFGGEISGVKVVVQMLTEEKREELDLETLWGQALARYTRRKDRIAKGQVEEAATSDHLGPPLDFNAPSSTLSLAP